MKYLYILSSDASDYHLEQAMLSITSLRIQMPTAFVSLLIDDITETTLSGNRGKIVNLVDELKVIDIDVQFDKKARSQWLKTSMRHHVEDDFLFINNDTIVSADLSSITNIETDLGAVLDEHLYLSEFEILRPVRLKEIKHMFKRCKFNSPFDFKIYFNSGVFFCRESKTAHDFFLEWHRLWLHCFKIGKFTGQPPLNQANFNMGNVIKELDGIWNCQIGSDGALRFLFNAKIIRCFETQAAEKPFLLANRDHLICIKKTGAVGDDTLEMLKTPKSFFSDYTHLMVLDKAMREFHHSAFFGAVKRIYFSMLGTIIKTFLVNISRFIFTPIRKKSSVRKPK